MSFNRPTLAALIDRAVADIATRLPGADARVRRSNLNVLSRVHAGAVHGLYGFLDWLSRQILPDTAEAEILDRHATIWLTQPRKAAEYAAGIATATGTDGTLIAAGTVMQRADGVEYASDSDATIAAGTASVSVTAVAAGQDGNADAGATLNLSSPIAGVNAALTVAAGGIVGGTNIETDDELRARVLARIKQAPHGGADFDYVAWALEVPGVTRAWCYPLELGAGTVTVRFVRDDDASLIPDAGEVTTVQDYIDARRPVTAAVTVVAPVADALDFTIGGLDPDTTAVRTAIETELADLLRREAEPEGGNGEGTILLSHIREAISIAAGEGDHVLTVPATDVTHPLGHMATMGTITWA